LALSQAANALGLNPLQAMRIQMAHQAAANAAASGQTAVAGTCIRGGLYGILILEIIWLIEETGAIIYYTYEYYDNRSDYYEMTEQYLIQHGYDLSTAQETAQQELNETDVNAPPWYDNYWQYMYQDYIGWWW
jgi:hypothetical protein